VGNYRTFGKIWQGSSKRKSYSGSTVFEAWINELAPAAEGTSHIWDKCLEEVRRAELVMAPYNRDAGWAKAGGEIGICHAELQEGHKTAPAKVAPGCLRLWPN